MGGARTPAQMRRGDHGSEVVSLFEAVFELCQAARHALPLVKRYLPNIADLMLPGAVVLFSVVAQSVADRSSQFATTRTEPIARASGVVWY
jgi:hypothetical protein